MIKHVCKEDIVVPFLEGITDKMILLIISGHGGHRTMAKVGKPLASNEEEETFSQQESFGDVIISVTGNPQKSRKVKQFEQETRLHLTR